jgi:DNA-binding transcriptional ArsR family regulator
MSRSPTTSYVFNAIAEPRRRQIIELLARRGALAVGTLVGALGLPQPSVSKHLNVLRQVGIVSVSKSGQQRVYGLNPQELRPVYNWVKPFEKHWTAQLDRIKQRAETKAKQQTVSSSQPHSQRGSS